MKKQTAIEFLIEEIECRGIITKELRIVFEQAKEMEKLKEEFAIEFVEWLLNEWVNDERWSIITNIKELLEIYKETL